MSPITATKARAPICEASGGHVRAIFRDSHEAAMSELLNVRPSRGRICPRLVAGKRCLVGNPGVRECVCQRFYPDPLDHNRIWIDEEGHHVLTAEPYGAGTDRGLLDFLQEMEALGLDVEIDSRSPWCPGSTIMLIVRRAGSQ